MIKRIAEKKLKQLTRSFPVVTITGPRQSGKTTLVRSTFPDKNYVNLENPNIRELATVDPIGFLNQFPKGAIIDEIQRVPQLFSYIQTIIDEKNINGFFILTGSNQFEFMHNLGQSLAGRTGILKLLPFSYQELYKDRIIPLNNILFTGFYPRIYDKKIPETDFYSSYVNTYIERDVRLISNVYDLAQFQRFISVCAARTGSILNKESLSNEVGISAKTVEEWLSILEASFLIYRLQPYYKNFNKRIIKSPKLYFLDTGLVSFILGIQDFKQLQNHPMRGELFETFIIMEFLKRLYNTGRRSNLYYYRDNNGNEIDVIIDTGFGPVPIEIKVSETINNSQFTSLQRFRKIGHAYHKAGLILGKTINSELMNTKVTGYNNVTGLFEQLTNDDNF
jgi:predicted AAA+ superfamily ATPase